MTYGTVQKKMQEYLDLTTPIREVSWGKTQAFAAFLGLMLNHRCFADRVRASSPLDTRGLRSLFSNSCP